MFSLGRLWDLHLIDEAKKVQPNEKQMNYSYPLVFDCNCAVAMEDGDEVDR